LAFVTRFFFTDFILRFLNFLLARVGRTRLARGECMRAPLHQQVHAAAATALTARRRGEMTTRNAHTEMIFCMSPNRNIKASLDQFGAGEATTDLLLAAFELDDTVASASSSSSSTSSSSSSSMSSTLDEFAAACSGVEGRRADPSALHERCNVAQICKVRTIFVHERNESHSSACTLAHTRPVCSSRNLTFRR
jgi:hypothetical protein